MSDINFADEIQKLVPEISNEMMMGDALEKIYYHLAMLNKKIENYDEFIQEHDLKESWNDWNNCN